MSKKAVKEAIAILIIGAILGIAFGLTYVRVYGA